MTVAMDRLVISVSASIRDALIALDGAGTGFLAVVDEAGRLAGVVTDGDIRRALLRGSDVDGSVRDAMTADCVALPVEASDAEIHRSVSGPISFVPLLDGDRRPVDWAGRSRHHRLPVMEPTLDGNELAYVEEAVQTGWISSQGPFVARFESLFAELHGAPHALSVSNGTVALHLALVALGVGAGDEVLVPDFTFAATASAVVHAGATPVFVDVDRATWTMDPAAMAAAVTPRTKAVIPVHIYGHPADMDAIGEVAAAHGLAVVEDAAEALGSRIRGRIVGGIGDAGCFSFFGNKTITTGEGGMILFRDEAVYRRARMLRDHGMSPERRYWHLEPGFNYRLTNLQAAVGVAQLERVDAIFAAKRAMAARYDEALARLPGITPRPVAPWADPVCWLYTITVGDGLGLSRDELASRLLQTGVETRPVFHPLSVMPAFARWDGGAPRPVAADLARTGLSLPSAVGVTADDAEGIARRIGEIAAVRQMASASGSLEQAR
jgi:perosamine synthetase